MCVPVLKAVTILGLISFIKEPVRAREARYAGWAVAALETNPNPPSLGGRKIRLKVLSRIVDDSDVYWVEKVIASTKCVN